jgi:hypothetical protein
MGATATTFLSTYFDDDKTWRHFTNEDVSRALKVAATLLDYLMAWGIPMDRINTHLLRSG